MKKIVLSVILACGALLASHTQAETVRLCSPVDCTIFGISDNGDWAVGMQGNAMSEMYAFRWNLITNEVEVSDVPSECGNSIANDGTFCGGFPYKDKDGRTVVGPGFYDGTWHALPVPEGTVSDAFDGSISPDGRHMAITVELNGIYQVVQYEDKKFVRVLKSDNDHSRVYCITNDGSRIGGWTNAHIRNLTVNRTGVYWEGDSEYKIIDADPENPYRAPWAGVNAFTSDGVHALFNGGWVSPKNERSYVVGIKNLITGEIAPVYPIDDNENSELLLDDIADDLTVVGTYGGFAVISQNGKTSYFVDWLLDKYGVDAKKDWTEVMTYEGAFLLQRAQCIQNNGKSVGIMYNGSDMEMHSMVVKFDVNLSNSAPVYVKTSEVEKANAVRLEWVMPYGMDLSSIKGYNIYRDDVRINQSPVTGSSYYDTRLEPGKAYTYEVSAVYEEGESDRSEASTITMAGVTPEAPAMFVARQKGFNSVSLTWDHPYTNLVDKHYYDNQSMTEGFGASELNTTVEAGIKIDAEELALYGKPKVSAVEFYPMSKQENWKVSLYSQNASGKLSALVSYRVTQDLILGERNLFTLPEAVEVPAGVNLIASVSFTVVDESSMQNVMGMQFGKVNEGYSDLLRRVIIPPEDFQSFSEMAKDAGMNMRVSWKIGVILTPEGLSADIDNIDHYLLTRGGAEIYSGEDLKYVDANMAEGTYMYGVTAVYSDGRKSQPATVSQNVAARVDEAYAAQDVRVAADATDVTVTWKAPEDIDLTDITWAHGEQSSTRITAANNNYNLQAAAIYPPSVFSGLTGYNIVGAKFFPTCDATYTIIVDNGIKTQQVAYLEVDDFTQGKWNTVYFDEPVALNPNRPYRLIVDCYDVEDHGSPIAVDDGRGVDGYSCLINVSYEEEQWQEVSASIGKSCNWMIGLLVADAVPAALPVKGYDVRLDGAKLNDALIEETEYVYPLVSVGGDSTTTHKMYVDTWYEPAAVAVPGQPVTFTLKSAGVEDTFVADLNITNDGAILKVSDALNVALYDMNGVRVVAAESDSVRIDGLAAGIYVVKATTAGDKVMTTKVNIRH